MIRTPDQRVRVFVSSTLEELAAERQAAAAAITLPGAQSTSTTAHRPHAYATSAWPVPCYAW